MGLFLTRDAGIRGFRMKYLGAEIVEKDGGYWIEYDFGEVGPFETYDAASEEAEPGDEPINVCV